MYAAANPLRYTDFSGRCIWDDKCLDYIKEDWNELLVAIGARSAPDDLTESRPIYRSEVEQRPGQELRLKEYVAVESRGAPGTLRGFKGEAERFHEWRKRKEQVHLQASVLAAGVALTVAVPAAAPLLVETAGVSASAAGWFTFAGGAVGGIAAEYGATGRVTPEGSLCLVDFRHLLRCGH